MENNFVTDYAIIDKKEVYDGYAKIEELTIDDGTKKITREVLKLGNGVGAIIKDTVTTLFSIS